MAEPGGVVILTYRHPLQYLLVNQLAGRFPVRCVIYERQGAGKLARLLARRAKRLGWGTALAQVAYAGWDRLAVQRRSARRIEELLRDFDMTPPGAQLPQMEVESHNGDDTAGALAAIRPQVVVLAGAPILQPHILEKAPVFLNVHAGITPRYRGAHGAFWAVWEGQPDLAGVTVHVVDRGIDTGGIVAQATIAPSADDTPRTLVAKQTAAAVPLLIEAVRQALDGQLTTYRRDDLESRLWYPPTPLSYLRFRRQLARLARSGQLAPRTDAP